MSGVIHPPSHHCIDVNYGTVAGRRGPSRAVAGRRGPLHGEPHRKRIIAPRETILMG